MKRPSFQFYPGDWTGNGNLKRCSHKLKGVWMDVLCLLHDSETEYGLLRWPLKEIAQAAGCKVADLAELVDKHVLKGADTGQTCRAFVYTPRSGRKDGTPVVLIPEQPGPVWYSSRMVRDEYVRSVRGESTRFEEGGKQPEKPAPKKPPKRPPKVSPKGGLGDGSSSSSSTSSSPSVNTSPPSGAPSVEGEDGPVLTGKEQRSPTALKSCPKSFVVTEELVQEALANCPHLTLDDLKRETRLFRGNRFKNARLEWATTWLNWMETEDKKRSERAQSRVTGATTYRAERDARVAQAAPGIAAAAPAVRVPGSPLTVVEDVTDAQPRTPRIAQG